MLSCAGETARNGPANNTLFVLDKPRKKLNAGGQEAEETLLVHAYIYFFIPLYKWALLEILVLTVV